jgi:hypothetical protein
LPWLTVVGEIGDVKYLAAEVPTMSKFYIPISQVKARVGPFATRHLLVGNGSAIVLGSQRPSEQIAGEPRAAPR